MVTSASSVRCRALRATVCALLLAGLCQLICPTQAIGGDAAGDPYMTKAAAAGKPPGGGYAAAAGSSLNSGDPASQQAGKFMPDGISRADKLRAFLECRKECVAKCDRLVYVYSTKKEFCHDCIRQCMVSVLQQARSLGIEFSSQEERMQGDSPSENEDRDRGGGRRQWRGRQQRQLERKKARQERRRQRKEQEKQKLLKNCIVH